MQEIALEKPKTLEELNRKFRVWCDEGYNNNPHSGIKGKTPMQAYLSRSKEGKVYYAGGMP